MADHIVSTLQMLSARYPDSGLILGADRNEMDILPVLNCGLKLRQMVNMGTRHGKILDIIIMNMKSYYNSAIIVPPIKPDNPSKGKPSDHWVPVCTPHTDRHNPPSRLFKTIKYRPLSDSSVRSLVEWIVKEDWQSVDTSLSASEQVASFESLCQEKLDLFCPIKEFRVSTQDKLFITAELKKFHRQKSREYTKRGKTIKYKQLAEEFKSKYKIEAQKYFAKNVHELRESNPGQAYDTLRAQPGECLDTITFTLTDHESRV